VILLLLQLLLAVLLLLAPSLIGLFYHLYYDVRDGSSIACSSSTKQQHEAAANASKGISSSNGCALASVLTEHLGHIKFCNLYKE